MPNHEQIEKEGKYLSKNRVKKGTRGANDKQGNNREELGL
jgi:hypothetical protein